MESVKQILDLELYFHTKFNGCWYKITNDISGLNILFYQRCTDEMLKIFDSLYKKYFETGYNVRKTDNIQTENEFRKECEETFSFYLSQHSYEMEYEKPTDCYLITKINNQRVDKNIRNLSRLEFFCLLSCQIFPPLQYNIAVVSV